MAHIHIGHTFYGAGNLGDDLMLGGFLKGIGSALAGMRLTCATPFDIDSQKRRFPEVGWYPYESETCARLIAECDAWLGLGGSILSALDDGWLLSDQLFQLDLCRQANKPVYFLGCGVDRRAIEREDGPRQLLQAADWIWPRDSLSASALTDMGFDRMTPAADLSHLALADMASAAPTQGETAFILNFEVEAQYRDDMLVRMVSAAAESGPVSWLVQEVRALKGSEEVLFKSLPEDLSRRVIVRRPDYTSGSLVDLVHAWGRPERLFTSRFHGAIIGSWLGSRVVVFERAAKLVGVAKDLDITAFASLLDPEDLRRAFEDAAPVDTCRLRRLAERAQNACSEFLYAANGSAA